MKYTFIARSLVVMMVLSLGLNSSYTKDITEAWGQEKLINLVTQLEKLVENKAELAKYKAEIKGLKAQTIIENKKELSFKEFLQKLKYHMTTEKACILYAEILPILGMMTGMMTGFVISAATINYFEIAR